MSLFKIRENADHLVPKGWRWRVVAERHPTDDTIHLHDPKTGARLAVIVPESPGSYVVVDGNMVTRWYTLDDAVLYAAQARIERGRPWPLSRRQFWGDSIHHPAQLLAGLLGVALGLWVGVDTGSSGWGFAIWFGVSVAARFAAAHVFPEYEADHDQTDACEVAGWPDGPRWSALFDSTVWYPGEKETV